ncbi:FtsX-like permease family protein [Kitasatospora sp. NPDC101801]|uniref:FtsX-like permease family protein n=1 Tax=Kitasatospora sp. NPDC101801 TaxID=3364103 RepID=UPI00380AD72F
MTTGLARASLRSRPAAAVGVLAALVLSATVITASVAVLVTASAAPPSPQREDLTTIGIGFTLVTVYLSIFATAQVAALAVAQRQRETALLRTVGAGPWQVRRAVVAETLLTAAPALPAGYGAGVLLARWWFGAMADRGLVPTGLRLTVGWPPAVAAAVVLVVTALLGGLLAAQRAARLRPAAALGEAAGPGGGPLWLRGVLAAAALAGAVVLQSAVAAEPAEEVAEHVPLLLLAYLVAVALAGPLLGRLAAAVAAVPLRLCGAPGELAVANSRARSRRLSAAITPVALVVAFTLAKLGSLVGRQDPPWIDLFATALYGGFAALVAVDTLVMLMLARRREVALLRLIGAGPAQLVRMALLEAALVAGTAFGLGAAVAGAATAPLVRLGAPGPAQLPVQVWGGLALAVTGLVVVSSVGPLVRLLTIRPASGVST